MGEEHYGMPHPFPFFQFLDLICEDWFGSLLPSPKGLEFCEDWFGRKRCGPVGGAACRPGLTREEVELGGCLEATTGRRLCGRRRKEGRPRQARRHDVGGGGGGGGVWRLSGGRSWSSPRRAERRPAGLTSEGGGGGVPLPPSPSSTTKGGGAGLFNYWCLYISGLQGMYKASILFLFAVREIIGSSISDNETCFFLIFMHWWSASLSYNLYRVNTHPCWG